MDKDEAIDIAGLLKKLQEADEAYAAAKQEEVIARSSCSNALNILNAAQKDFDIAVHQIQERAPQDSEWKRKIGAVCGVRLTKTHNK